MTSDSRPPPEQPLRAVAGEEEPTPFIGGCRALAVAASELRLLREAGDGCELPRSRVEEVEVARASARHDQAVQSRREHQIVESDAAFPAGDGYRRGRGGCRCNQG